MTTTPDTNDTELRAYLADLREHYLATDDGEPAVICSVDGYPSTMTCTCAHGHNRHCGTDVVRCMSYVGMPDCDCTGFRPDPASVTSLWLAHTAMLRALDVDAILALVPAPRASTYVRDWPADEQAVWDSYDKAPAGREAAMTACDDYRRLKVASAVLRAVGGLS